MIRRPPSSPLFPSTTLFRSSLVERGLAEGALGIGFGIAYTPGASREEILRVFRVAARHGVPCFVHLREGGRDPATGGSVAGVQEGVEIGRAAGRGRG